MSDQFESEVREFMGETRAVLGDLKNGFMQHLHEHADEKQALIDRLRAEKKDIGKVLFDKSTLVFTAIMALGSLSGVIAFVKQVIAR